MRFKELPSEVSIYTENSEDDNFDNSDRFERLEKVGFKIINCYYKAHMCGGKHLPCYTKSHGNACKVQAASLHCCNYGHYDGNMALAHTG